MTNSRRLVSEVMNDRQFLTLRINGWRIDVDMKHQHVHDWQEIKPGDHVRCHDNVGNEDRFDVGNVFTVEEVNDNFLRFKELPDEWWCREAFELCEEP